MSGRQTVGGSYADFVESSAIQWKNPPKRRIPRPVKIRQPNRAASPYNFKMGKNTHRRHVLSLWESFCLCFGSQVCYIRYVDFLDLFYLHVAIFCQNKFTISELSTPVPPKVPFFSVGTVLHSWAFFCVLSVIQKEDLVINRKTSSDWLYMHV